MFTVPPLVDVDCSSFDSSASVFFKLVQPIKISSSKIKTKIFFIITSEIIVDIYMQSPYGIV
ncbi:hypothetical protein DWQ65_03835 [Treponema phagedenis]|nr:hypothetical protein C5O78_07070 [Treponema phagedenis]QSH99211.1 hypothetical protein DWQ65_03835 [Treponema phagedenis]